MRVSCLCIPTKGCTRRGLRNTHTHTHTHNCHTHSHHPLNTHNPIGNVDLRSIASVVRTTEGNGSESNFNAQRNSQKASARFPLRLAYCERGMGLYGVWSCNVVRGEVYQEENKLAAGGIVSYRIPPARWNCWRTCLRCEATVHFYSRPHRICYKELERR